MQHVTRGGVNGVTREAIDGRRPARGFLLCCRISLAAPWSHLFTLTTRKASHTSTSSPLLVEV